MIIQHSLVNARQSIIDDFFSKIMTSLRVILDNEWTVELVGDLSKRYSFPLRIYKNEWIGSKDSNLIFGFEFKKHNYYDGYFGIVRKNDTDMYVHLILITVA